MNKRTCLETAVNTLKERFDLCSDFNIRQVNFPDGGKVYISNLGNYSDRSFISETIVKPLVAFGKTPENESDVFTVIASNELIKAESENDAESKLLSGFALIICEFSGEASFFCVMAKRASGRSVSEPDTETVVRGPREGFIESAEDNIALLRKRFKTTAFKTERLIVGKYTGTFIYIAYLEGAADKNTLYRVRKAISELDIPSVMDSGYIEHYLEKRIPSLFTNVGNSEKPDKVASKLVEGRIGIICDGSPVVLTVPYLFTESLQSSEDYLKTPYYASFIRVIRLIGLFIAMYLPALYLTLLEHHTGSVPYKLYRTIIESRNDLPFGVFGELLTILLIFELIREVGVRMPRAVGDAVGIVAGLILGDAAISAGIASAQAIMVVALTAVASFIVPPYMNSLMLIRLINLFLAKLLGFEGIALSFVFLLVYLCRRESFGVPYLTPFAPVGKGIFTDGIFMNPKKCISSNTTQKSS